MVKKMGVVLTVLLVGGGVWMWWARAHAEAQPAYRLVTLTRGDLAQTVRASGIVQPIRLVQVGTQVNGPIRKLNVDYNDRVKAGDIVGQIDPAVYEARYARDQANLAQSEANVEQAKAKLVQAEKELVRANELVKRDMLSASELDAALANRDTLAAQLKVANAAVEQARAALRTSKAELEYTTIRSPVDGVVISRNVSEGQTVVASMTAQVLFSIATDLEQIQVEASIPEADIGRIRNGQPVAFTVDAYDQEFTGTVSQIRLAADSIQNVVTYPVIILAANPDGKLFPGMTANISCEVARQTQVLRVPNVALRFSPSGGQPTPSLSAGEGETPPGPRLWVRDASRDQLRPIKVAVGISDGIHTELKDAGGLPEGASVVAGFADMDEASKNKVNLFELSMPRGARMR